MPIIALSSLFIAIIGIIIVTWATIGLRPRFNKGSFLIGLGNGLVLAGVFLYGVCVVLS